MNNETIGKTLVLFDGVCGFCNASVQFLLRHDPSGMFRFAPLQGEVARAVLAKHGKNPQDLDTVYVIEGYGTAEERVMSRSRAALHCASKLGWPWKLAAIGRVVPAAVMDVAYDLIARYRYRIFGKRDACMMPDPAMRERFL